MTATTTPLDGQEMSWDEYVALGDEPGPERVEYLHGRLVVSPAPRRTHQGPAQTS